MTKKLYPLDTLRQALSVLAAVSVRGGAASDSTHRDLRVVDAFDLI